MGHIHSLFSNILQVTNRSHKSHMQPVCSQVDMSCLCCMHETWTMSCAIKGQRILQKKGTLWLHRSQTQQKYNILTLSNTPVGVLYLPTEEVKDNINVSGNIRSARYTLQALHNVLHLTDGMIIMYNKTSNILKQLRKNYYHKENCKFR